MTKSLTSNIKELVHGFDPNLHLLGLFFPYSVDAYRKDGTYHEFDIEIRDMQGRPDCKIGNFSLNVWYRTNAAMRDNWEGYSSYQELARQVENRLEKEGYTQFNWKERR